MDTLEQNIPAVLENWRFLDSPPLSGPENMRLDADVLAGVEEGRLPPTLRFFRFNAPTVSFGRLQKLSDVSPLAPFGWDCVQRPTGGGIVFHEGDLCLSLSWAGSLSPLPNRPQDQYRWIHGIILEALAEDRSLRMAACCDQAAPKEAFPQRTCFNNPVGYDLLQEQQKIVGGALRCTRRATLYQGSIQMKLTPEQERRLFHAFHARLAAL